MRADLHLHTWYSDGAESPVRVVELASRSELDLIAITDHDSTGGVAEAVEAGVGRGVRVIPAAELTTTLHGMDVHLLAYFSKSPGEPLQSHLSEMQTFRRQRIEQAIVQLRTRGYSISLERLPAADCCESLTSAHLARMLLAEGFARSLRTVWRRKAVRDALGGFEAKTEDVVGIIHDSGGLAVWAHPAKKRFARRLADLAEHGLDGIEVQNLRRGDERTESMLTAARERGMIVTSGSDWHEGPGLGERAFEGDLLDEFLARLG